MIQLDLGNVDHSLLVFGGPYSNLLATQAMRCRAEALEIPPSRVICSGDLVAYCAEPAETVDLIREWGIHVVKGNCEESLAMDQSDCGCGFDPDSYCSVLAMTWYQYANLRISREQRLWMHQLPDSIQFEMADTRVCAVHGNHSHISEFVFASSDPKTKSAQLQSASAEVMIGGHSGIPFGQRIAGGLWLNAGVIGMPANDRATDGWYMLIEVESTGLAISWHQLEYDYQTSANTTRLAGMTEYGQALIDGIWPSMDVLPEEERQQAGQKLNLKPLLYEPTR